MGFTLNPTTGELMPNIAPLINIHTDSQEPTGFENRTDSSLSFSDGNRTLTITGTNFKIYYRGNKYLKSTESIQIDDTTGQHWIYYDSTGTLSKSNDFPGFNSILVASIYWNTAAGMDKGLVADERHGIRMDSDTHEYLHDTVGVRYESGLAGTFTNTTLSVTAGVIHDEDIDFTITPTQTTCDVLYKDGSADYKWLSNQTLYYYTSGGSLYYNNGNTLTAVPANQYVAYWVFATTSITMPIVVLMGQRVDVTLADARNNNTYASLALGTLPFKEMKILYRVILRNDATPYEETQDLRSVSNLSTGTYVATDHTTLSNIGVYTHAEIDAYINGPKIAPTNYTGADCTGSDGATNRTLATSGVSMVVVDNMFLHPDSDYDTSGTTITFFNEIWDSSKITVWN